MRRVIRDAGGPKPRRPRELPRIVPKVVAILDFAISAAARIDCRQAPTHVHNDSSIT